MKSHELMLAVASLSALAACGAVTSAPIHVRAPNAEARVWQARPPLEEGVIKWRWDGADSARLTVTSVVSRTVLLDRAAIAAAPGELYGSWQMPARTEGENGLYDLVLELLANGSVTNVLQARVAALPAALTLRGAPGTKEWSTLPYDKASLFAYDAAWTNLSGAATLTLAPRRGAARPLPLSGTSGFDAIHTLAEPAASLGYFTARLAFGGTDAYATDLAFPGGMCIMFR